MKDFRVVEPTAAAAALGVSVENVFDFISTKRLEAVLQARWYRHEPGDWQSGYWTVGADELLHLRLSPGQPREWRADDGTTIIYQGSLDDIRIDQVSLERLKAELGLDDSGAASTSGTATVDDAADRRAVAVLSARGVRREILEHWDGIKAEYGADAGRTLVARYLTKRRDPSEKKPDIKTISNELSELRGEKLIP